MTENSAESAPAKKAAAKKTAAKKTTAPKAEATTPETPETPARKGGYYLPALPEGSKVSMTIDAPGARLSVDATSEDDVTLTMLVGDDEPRTRKYDSFSNATRAGVKFLKSIATLAAQEEALNKARAEALDW